VKAVPGAGGRLLVGRAAGGSLAWAAADVTAIIEEARRRLDFSPLAASACGRALAGAALLLRLARKPTDRLVLEIRGDGPLRLVIAEVDAEGNLRGMVGQPKVDLPPTAAGKPPVGQGIGKGLLRVHREQDGASYQSQVALVTGEIGSDLAHYLEQSEQTQSAVLVGVLAKPDGVAAAGGMIVEVLPGAKEDAITALESNIRDLGGVSRRLEEEGLAGLSERLLSGLDPELGEERPLRYRCRCSRERLRQHLIVLSADDREHLRHEDGTTEAECVFCGEIYRFDAAELRPD
jgi:molecular chaperone Hsp33